MYYSDNTLRIWDTESSKEMGILEGHESRIWDVSSNKNGSMVSSASGDGTIKVRRRYLYIFLFMNNLL